MTVNSVVGGGIRNPDDAMIIAERARSLGFSTTVGIIHDGLGGELAPLEETERTILDELVALGRSTFDFATTTGFKRTWRMGAQRLALRRGSAVTSMSARTASSTGARSSAGIRASH